MNQIHPLLLPRIGTNDDAAALMEWLKPSGAYVQRGEILCVVETSKTVFEVEAAATGYLYPLAEVGNEVAVGGTLALISPEPLTPEQVSGWQAEPEPVEAVGEAAAAGEPVLTYKAQLLARRHGLEMQELTGLGGKVTEQDVLNLISQRSQKTQSQPEGRDLMADRYPQGRSERILIIGGGDGAVQILDVLAKTPHQRAVAIVDDNPTLVGRTIDGVPVVGGIVMDEIAALFERREVDKAVISISTLIPLRARLYEQLQARGVCFANIIHPSAVIGSNVALGEGNVIMAFCHIGACAALGNNNFLSAYCSIEHHATMGNHCSFGPAVVTSSRVQFGDRVRCGTGIFVEPKLSIGSDAIIGSGCIIREDIPEATTLKTQRNYVARRRTVGT